ncbi:MAG: hypothetical protein C0601_03055 [Candidatus Muiribacterium halophilum]|uniref:Uncharacterized protein n=1 Tax=Muiribacterium halophilum TaxID=2053465 RepID=A0A2N5ZK46_MUIH1|nr:MAG: hypothetical protein C0601_03055 [Candidatus Muirbacterium halophilum]
MKIKGRIALFFCLLFLFGILSYQFSNLTKGKSIYTYKNEGYFYPIYLQNNELYLRKDKKEIVKISDNKNERFKFDPILHYHQIDSPFTCEYLNNLDLTTSAYTFLNKDKELIQEFYSIYNSPVWECHDYVKTNDGNTVFLSTSDDLIFLIQNYLDVFEKKGISKDQEKYILNLNSRRQISPRIKSLRVNVFNDEYKQIGERIIPIENNDFSKEKKLNMFFYNDIIYISMITTDKITIISLDKELSFNFSNYLRTSTKLPDRISLKDGSLILLSYDKNILDKTVIDLKKEKVFDSSIKCQNKIIDAIAADTNRTVILSTNESRDFIKIYYKQKNLRSIGLYYPGSFKNLIITKDKNHLIYQEQTDENTFNIYRKRIF